MMTPFRKTVSLHAHPASPDSVLTAIHVDVAIIQRQLRLTYHMVGNISQLAIPDYEEPVRSDGLWQETCCEAFLKTAAGPVYYEFNFSPSTQWAVYRFTDYRAGMRPVDVGAAPVLDRAESLAALTLSASVDVSMLPTGDQQADWALGVSCVVKSLDGKTSFWALAHPPGKADFHHEDCFALQIRAAERS